MQATEHIATTDQAAPPAEDASPVVVEQDRSGESGRAPADKAAVQAGMNAWMRGELATSKPAASEPAGESAPTDGRGDVKPAERVDPLRDPQGRFSRRGVPEAVKSAEQRAAELEAQLAERDPEKIRAQVRAEIEAEQSGKAEQAKLDELTKSQQADVEKYRRLNDVPDYKLDPADRQWLQDFKDKLDLFPEVKQFHEADTARRIKAASDAHTTALLSSLARHVKLPGVDEKVFRSISEYGALGDHLYEAGGRSRQPEIDKLKAENDRLAGEVRQLSRSGNGGMGAIRDPSPPGRSSSAVPRDGHTIVNDWLRGL